MRSREELNIEWAVSNLRLSGSRITEEKAAKICRGEYVLDATIEDHMLVNDLIDLLPLMYDLKDMQEELSPKTLDKFYFRLSGGEMAEYRKTTPVLFHLSYNPVLPQEIDGELRKLFAGLHDGRLNDPLERSVYVHNELIRIYPFGKYSELIARTAMAYEQMYSGLPVVLLTLNEQEYNHALAKYLKTGKEDVLTANLRMNLLMLQSQYESYRQT